MKGAIASSRNISAVLFMTLILVGLLESRLWAATAAEPKGSVASPSTVPSIAPGTPTRPKAEMSDTGTAVSGSVSSASRQDPPGSGKPHARVSGLLCCAVPGMLLIVAGVAGFVALSKRRGTQEKLRAADSALVSRKSDLRRRIDALESQVGDIVESPHGDLLSALQFPLPPSWPQTQVTAVADKFVEGLRRIQRTLEDHPNIRSNHLQFADQLRALDITAAEALVKKTTQVTAVCPSCQAQVSCPLDFAGKKAHCPQCRQVFSIPSVDTDIRQGRNQEALTAQEIASRVDALPPEIRKQILALIDSGKTQEAVQLIGQSCGLGPKLVQVLVESMVRRRRATAQGRSHEVLTPEDAVAKVDALPPEVKRHLLELVVDGRTPEAVQVIRQSCALDPELAQVLAQVLVEWAASRRRATGG